MSSTLSRLIGYPHAAVFDKAPIDELVFRLSHPSGATWTVSEAVMSATAGATTTTYDLSSLTVAQLVTELQADGYVVTEVAGAYANMSALVLVEGSGDQGTSNGDRVTGYTSLMWVLMGGYAGVIRDAGVQVIQALRQMIITQAEGEWLDLWGKIYGIGRTQAETDQHYAPRIPKEAFRLRESPIAIEEAIFDATGKVVRIEEPWGNIFRLDGSKISGPDKFQDGSHIGYFLIQPTSPTPIDWSDVMPVIDRNRAAGVLVLPPFTRNRMEIDANIVGTVHSAITSIHTRDQKYEDRTLLDYSLIEDVPILNHPLLRKQTVRHVSWSTANSGWLESSWPDTPWSDSSYSVGARNYRSYRVYKFEVFYESRFWEDLVWPDVTWNDFNVLIGSSHTRS